MKKKMKLMAFLCVVIGGAFMASPALAEEMPKVYSEGYFQYYHNQDYASLVGYFGSDPVVEVPAFLGGVPLSVIRDGAFVDGENMSKIILPDTVMSVSANAFKGCEGVEIVYEGEAVEPDPPIDHGESEGDTHGSSGKSEALIDENGNVIVDTYEEVLDEKSLKANGEKEEAVPIKTTANGRIAYPTGKALQPHPTTFNLMGLGAVIIGVLGVMVGMEMGTAEFDGCSGERDLRYFEERAKGGVGLIITGTCKVNNKSGIESPAQISMTDDKHIAPFKELADAVHAQGTKIFVQLHHPGRQTLNIMSFGWPIAEVVGKKVGDKFYDVLFGKVISKFSVSDLDRPIVKFITGKVLPPVLAPSSIPCGLGGSPIHDTKTRALSRKEIKELVNQFADAAVRAKKAGADGVEIHAGHGYLIEEFLSPRTNLRTDEYGGSLENRMRFISEIISEIKVRCGGNYPMIVRLGVEEYYDSIGLPNAGIKIDEGVEMAKRLEALGVHGINVTCGTYETSNFSIEPTSYELGCRSKIIKAVKDAVNIPVIAVNLTRTPKQAEEYLQDGLLDFIGLGRPLLADPYFMKKAMEGREDEIQRCICCLWCIESVTKNQISGQPAECALNPRTCRELTYSLEPKKDGEGRVVAIVGGGPAGLTAAKTLGQRGFKPVLFEKNDHLGGQLYLASLPPHKEKLKWAIEDLTVAAKKSGAEIRLNTLATLENIKKLNPYAVIDATGGESVKPKIKGSDKEHVCTVTNILEGEVKPVNKKVVVIGSGMTGLETAEMIAQQGNKVTIVEMANTVAPGTWSQHLEDILPRLNKLGVEIVTGQKLVEIEDSQIIIESVKTNFSSRIDADAVVLAIGVKSNDIASKLKPHFSKVYKVGDAEKTGRIANAVHTAYKTSLAL